MKRELDRVKSDVETIQRAMGLAPSMGREWIEWMKRDKWFSLWWCLPGLILITSALLPLENAGRYFGLAPGQWAGVLVAAVMLGITVIHCGKIAANDSRPTAMIRECKRMNGMTGEGLWFSLALLVQVLLYFTWAKLYHIDFDAFWAGLFLFSGATGCILTLPP